MRVAVTGVPRGGTSAVAGLCRILGYSLPVGNTDCVRSESRLHRLNPEHPDVPTLVRRIHNLPDGTVWKDPSAGDYALRVDWSNWAVVQVTRDADAVRRSEARWPDGARETPEKLRVRNHLWRATLSRATKPVFAVDYEDVLTNPVDVLRSLHATIGQTELTKTQLNMAVAFVSPDRGYRCPQPDRCRESH